MVTERFISVGFVVYYPGANFFDRLELATRRGFKCYVFDNSPEVASTKFACKSLASVVYATAGKNVGLGVSLCVINATAHSDCHNALLFFDQDSRFTAETLEYINAFVLDRFHLLRQKYVAVAFAEGGGLRESDAKNVDDVILAISSGSLFILENLKEIGWHNDKYFVDGVDYELCLRARRRGYRIGRNEDAPGFDHISEQPDRLVKILGKTFKLRRYSIGRIFDSATSYLKLIGGSLARGDVRITTLIIRSLIIFCLGQILSRVLLKR